MNELGSQITLAAVASTALEWLKRSKYFPLLTMETSKLNRMVAIVLSFAGAAGVSATYDSSAHTLLIAGLDWHSISHFAWTWLSQFVIQHGYFSAVVKQPDTVPTISAEGQGQAVVSVSPAAAGAKVEDTKKP